MRNGQERRRGDKKVRGRKDAGGRSREEREKSGDVAMETKVGHRGVGIEKIVEEENRGPTTKRCGGDITMKGCREPRSSRCGWERRDVLKTLRHQSGRNGRGNDGYLTRGSEVTVERFGEIMLEPDTSADPIARLRTLSDE